VEVLRRAARAPEQVSEAGQKLWLRKLVDVALEGVVDEPPRIMDARVLGHPPHARLADLAHELALDLRMAKVEEVTGIIPDEPVSYDGSAIPADLLGGLADQVVSFRELAREGEPRHAGADDQKTCVHSPPSLIHKPGSWLRVLAGGSRAGVLRAGRSPG
jgi:hypothetical protein